MKTPRPDAPPEAGGRISALIAAEVEQALARFPDPAFAAEARRRLAARQARRRSAPAGFGSRLALPLAAALLMGVSIAAFLDRAGRFRPPEPAAPTLGARLTALEAEQPARSRELPASRDPLAAGLQRMMDLAAESRSAAATGSASIPDAGGVEEMLRTGAHYRFLRHYLDDTQEG